MVAWKTLGAACELGADGVIVRCGLNVRIFTQRHALAVFDPATPISEIPARCRCRCGAKAILPSPAWAGEGGPKGRMRVGASR